MSRIRFITSTWAILALLSGCGPQTSPAGPVSTADSVSTPAGPTATFLPTRPQFQPGELVDYLAQTGDTLPALARHFNTSVA